MAKLIITLDGVVVRDFPVSGARISIGRKPDNTIHLDDQTVSSEHAAISPGATAAITDLNSTNGTFVNGLRVRGKQTLRHGDVVKIGQHELRYIDETYQDFASTVLLEPDTSGPVARLCVLAGSRAGQCLQLDKPRTTVGRPGVQVAVIVREGSGYVLVPVLGKEGIKLNGAVVKKEQSVLNHGDVIEIAGSRTRFELDAEETRG